MNEYTFVGDPHIKNSNLSLVTKLFTMVEKAGRPVIWLGDMLDTKEVIRGKCLNLLLEYCAVSKLRHYILVGNHDWFNLECEAHALEALKLLPNVTVVDRPMTFVNLPFYMVPYIHDQSKLRGALDAGPEGSVLIAHLEMKGYDFGNGHICKNGLTVNDLSKFKRVISGHFHKHQVTGNFVYLGTPFSHSFGEANQKKFIGVYDIKSDELKFEPSLFRKHVSVTFDCNLLNEEKNHWIINIEDPTWKENLYRVILTGTQENIDRFPKWMYQQGGTEGRLNIKWVSRPSDFSTNDVQIDETISNENQFVKWANEVRGLDASTIQLGLTILESVK